MIFTSEFVVCIQSATARARKAEKEKKLKGAGSNLKANAQAASRHCNICRQSFLCTANRGALEQHVDSKHPKLSFKECFPNE
jgi:hypothetical protein